MDEVKLDIYEVHIFRFISQYKKIVNYVIDFLDLIVLYSIGIAKTVIFSIIEVFRLTGKVMRYTTIPIHWLWIWHDLNRMTNDSIEELPHFQVGAQYIYGRPGDGKSTFIYHSMMDYAYHTGKCSYTTAMMETPRKDLNGKEYYYHQLFKPSDFYKEGEQVAGFDSKHFNIVVYEEMLTQYQQRNNAKKSYNDEVLPMVASMGTQRHQGIDLFYFISQLPKNDIAIMLMLAGYHKIKVRKVLDYKHWLETGKIHFRIHGWKVTSYTIEPSGMNDYKLLKNKTWFYKNKYPEDMAYFNRLNMKEKYAKLPKMKGEGMQA